MNITDAEKEGKLSGDRWTRLKEFVEKRYSGWIAGDTTARLLLATECQQILAEIERLEEGK